MELHFMRNMDRKWLSVTMHSGIVLHKNDKVRMIEAKRDNTRTYSYRICFPPGQITPSKYKVYGTIEEFICKNRF